MNDSMLRYIVSLAIPEINSVDVGKFHEKYPDSDAVRKDLGVLKNLGYISILWADNILYALSVNEKAINYIR